MLVLVDTKWRDLHIFSARFATEILLVSNVGTTSQRNCFLDCMLKHPEPRPQLPLRYSLEAHCLSTGRYPRNCTRAADTSTHSH